MVAYGLGILPLIRKMRSLIAAPHQPWYADDAAIMAGWKDIAAYYAALEEHGPRYGFHPEPSKSVLVVLEGSEATATVFFASQEFRVVTGAHATWVVSLDLPLLSDLGSSTGLSTATSASINSPP